MAGFLNLSKVKERGWTPAAIRNFLGEPDELRRNPHYKCAAPMQMFKEERVLVAEASDAFNAWKDKTAKTRSDAQARMKARMAAERKETLRWARTVPIEVPNLSWESVSCRAGTEDERRILNFLRHEMTDYEELLDETFGAVGINQAKQTIRDRVLAAIVRRYPCLSDAAKRQRAWWREQREYVRR